MAITVVSGNRGTATEKTSDATLSLTPSASLSAGNYGILAVVIDNPTTSEGETDHLSATDTQGHTWVKDREQTEANTAALTGVTIAVLRARLTNGLTTSDSIDMAIAGGSATAKGALLMEVSVGASQDLVLSTGGANGNNGVAATSYSVALSGLSSVAGLYVGVSGAEEELSAAITVDAAYTLRGSFGSGAGGANITNVIAGMGTLQNTSTGDTFDRTGLTSADRATLLVRYEEQAGAVDVWPGLIKASRRSLYAVERANL